MTHPPTDTIMSRGHRAASVLAATAYERFADVVDRLSEVDWDRPTDCAGWTVRHLVGHMVGAMRSAASVRELAGQQNEVKRRAKRLGGDEVDHMTAIQIERTQDLSVTGLARECRRLVGPATAGRRRPPALLRRFVSFRVEMGTLSERWSLGYFNDVILTRDVWLHRVDLCRAVDAELLLTPDHDGRIVADVVAEWGRRHGQPYRLILTGPAGGRFVSGVDGEEIELDAVEFCRILSGRATGEGLLATAVPF